jgi:hypothetical protein
MVSDKWPLITTHTLNSLACTSRSNQRGLAILLTFSEATHSGSNLLHA